MEWKYPALLLCTLIAIGSAGCTPGDDSDAPPATATAPQSADGIPAGKNGYAVGSGTYYVATRREVPPNWGNARTWYAYAKAAGYAVGDIPRPGAIAWTDRGPYGQVAYVEAVSADGTQMTISEMGYDHDKVITRTASPQSFKYIY